MEIELLAAFFFGELFVVVNRGATLRFAYKGESAKRRRQLVI